MPRPAKPKQAKWEPIPSKDNPGVYRVYQEQVQHHDDLTQCRIKLSWLLGQKADESGTTNYSDTHKCHEADMRYHKTDYIIGLDKTWWDAEDTTDEARAFEMDTALAKIAAVYDAQGEHKLDTKKTKLWRRRPADYAGYTAVTNRHSEETAVEQAALPPRGPQLELVAATG